MTGIGASYAVAGTRFTVRWVPETGSTNADLLDAARTGETEGQVLVADHQTAGRGRLGRTWEAPTGAGLLFSVLLRPALFRPALAAEDAHLVTAALGLAARDALDGLGAPVGLKWPNDLVAVTDSGERKLAGILAESVIEGDRMAAIVVGMGINVAWRAAAANERTDLPDEIRSIGVALDELHVVVDRRTLLGDVLTRLEGRYGALGDPAGRVAVVEDYRAACVTVGRDVRVERPGGELRGRAVDIGPGGELVVDPDGGGSPVAVVAGDVVHLR